jgi:hypothetical protein
MNYKQQARDIIRQAQQEAEKRLIELSTVSLPSELKRVPKAKQAGHLNERIEKLNRHLAKSLNPLLDIEKRGVEEVVNALAALIRDREEDGKQLPSNIEYTQRIKDNELARLYAAYLTSIVDGGGEELSSKPEPVRPPEPKRREPKPPANDNTSLASLFINPTHYELTIKALNKLGLISDTGEWIEAKNCMGVLADVLIKRGLINQLSDTELVPIIAKAFKTSISRRATSDRPSKEEKRKELTLDLHSTLPTLPTLQ